MTDGAMDLWLRQLNPELVWGEVLVRRQGSGFELLHVRDGAAGGGLRQVSVTALRDLAQETAGGQFRPLRLAPTLRDGWVCGVDGVAALGDALHQLYPGSVGDWAAWERGEVATSYREYVGRQTGMYRVTAKLTDAEVADVAGVCCSVSRCLKHRRWAVPGGGGEEGVGKSLIPCMEPCPVLLEVARKQYRLGQEDRVEAGLGVSEWGTVVEALRMALGTAGVCRDAEVDHPLNGRRVALILRRLEAHPGLAPAGESD